MKTIGALGALALMLGLALPGAAQSPETPEAMRAQMGPGGGGPGMGGPGMQDERGWGRGHGPFRHGHMGPGRSVVFMALRHQKELGLSAQQVSSLQQLGMEARRAVIKRRADVQLAQLDLVSLLRVEPVDMEKMEAKVREMERLKADGLIDRIRTNDAAKAQLTPEQREQLKTLRAGWWQRRGGREGAGAGGSDERPSMGERS